MGKKDFTTGIEDVTSEGNDVVTPEESLPPATLAEQAAGRDALARVYANRVMPTEVEAPKE